MGFLLLCYLILFIGVTIIGRSYLVWRRTGVNPNVLGQGGATQAYIGNLFRLTLALLVVIIISYTCFPFLYLFLSPITWLERPWLSAIGVAFLSFALLWVFIAQLQMGDTWRIGFNKKEKTKLVQQGVYRLSRNPIFLGMRLLLLGLFLTLPSAVILALWWLGDVLLQIQVRLEEEYLSSTHGELYQTYTKTTRRWL